MRAHMRNALALIVLFSAPALAQAPAPALTAADYARAERFMTYNTTPRVLHGGGPPTFRPDDRFWYRTRTERGEEAVLVDSARATRAPCELAACRERRSETEREGRRDKPPRDVLSPDGKRAAFIRDWNLWVRDVATGRETPLTTDGVKDFGYSTDNAGWTFSERPIVLWSPDSKKIATFRQDQRNTGEMYLVETKFGHPILHAWKYPLPGDKVVTMIHRVVIEVDKPKVVRFQMGPDQHRSSLCDAVACRGGEWADVEWSRDGSRVAFVSTSRDHKREQFRIADAA